jgi:nucleoside-diphosphate-sugar epimerase
MSVLVTGSSGFLGSALVERLLAHGECEVRCLVRPRSNLSKLRLIEEKYPQAKLNYVVGTLTSRPDALQAVDGVETVYHLAASMKGAPATMFFDTVVGSKYLLEAILKSKPRRVVLISSLGVYGVSGLRARTVIDENTHLEQHPEKRDAYSYAKLRQEQLFSEYQERGKFELVTLRPGVLYGPGATTLPTRIGIKVGGLFFHLGRNNLLPISHVDNCAEAIVIAGRSQQASQQAYNVLDDDLPTTGQYLRLYRREVRIRVVHLPFLVTRMLSVSLEHYHVFSHGQLPAVLTPYKSAALWKSFRFDNRKLKSIGWRPIVSTEQGLRATFNYLKTHRYGNAVAL